MKKVRIGALGGVGASPFVVVVMVVIASRPIYRTIDQRIEIVAPLETFPSATCLFVGFAGRRIPWIDPHFVLIYIKTDRFQ